MKKPEWDSLRRDIGGKFIGDPRTFLYFVPLAWFLSMVSSDIGGDRGIFAATMMANAIAFAGCYGLLLVFRATIFRERHRRTIALSVAIGAGMAVGAVKVVLTALVTGALTGEWGGVDPLAVRIVAGAITGAWFFPVAAIIMSLQDRYRTARELVVAERLRVSETSGAWHSHDEVPSRLAAVLDDARQAISEHRDHPAALAASLTELLDGKIRPLSRDLLSGQGRKTRDYSAGELLRIVVSRHKYWPTLTTLALVLSSGPLIVSTVGWAEGIGRLGILGAVAWLVLTALGRVPSGRASQGAVVFVGAVIANAGINELLAQSMFGNFGNFSIPFAIFLNSALFGALALLLGAVRVTRSELDALLGELAAILGKDYFERQIERELVRARHRELAHVIHGRLQNQILGVVLALSKNPETSTTEDLMREIELLDAAITARDPLGRLPSDGDLSQELAALVARWAGIIDVTVTTHGWATAPAQDVPVLVGVAEEGITNAVRHGLASSVTISVGKEKDHWRLSVSDDGVGPRGGLPGIGTLTLNKVAGNSWALSANPHGAGSILTADVPSREKQ